jgi:hypothetical protein
MKNILCSISIKKDVLNSQKNLVMMDYMMNERKKVLCKTTTMMMGARDEQNEPFKQ